MEYVSCAGREISICGFSVGRNPWRTLYGQDKMFSWSLKLWVFLESVNLVIAIVGQGRKRSPTPEKIAIAEPKHWDLYRTVYSSDHQNLFWLLIDQLRGCLFVLIKLMTSWCWHCKIVKIFFLKKILHLYSLVHSLAFPYKVWFKTALKLTKLSQWKLRTLYNLLLETSWTLISTKRRIAWIWSL